MDVSLWINGVKMRAKDLRQKTMVYGDFSSKSFIQYLKYTVEKQLWAAADVLKNYADTIDKSKLTSINAFRTSIENALKNMRSLASRAKQLDESPQRKQLDRLAGDLETFKEEIQAILRDISKHYKAVDRDEHKVLIKELYQTLVKVTNAIESIVTEIDAIINPQKNPSKDQKTTGMFGKLKTSLGL